MTIWASSVALDWAPTLEYFEHRLELPRSLKDTQELRGFSVSDDSLGLRVGPDYHEVQWRASGLTITEWGPGFRSELLRDVVGKVVSLSNPGRCRSFAASFEIVEPISGRYDDVRSALAERMLGSTIRLLGVYDSAILVDGKDATSTYQFEFGVVNSMELRERLRNPRVGRADATVQARPEKRVPKNLPEVACFLTVTYRQVPAALSTDPTTIETLIETWDQLEAKANSLASSVSSLTTEAYIGRTETSK